MALPGELRTEHLLLRRFRFSDVDDVLGYANDEEWGRYLPIPWPYERVHAEQFIARTILADPAKRSSRALDLGRSEWLERSSGAS